MTAGANDVEQHGRWAGHNALTTHTLGIFSGLLSSHLPGGGSVVGAPREHTWRGSLTGVWFVFPVPCRARHGVWFLTVLQYQAIRLTQAQLQFLRSGLKDMKIHWLHQPGVSATSTLGATLV